ncbi:cupredoxin domain-containing protein [Ramlibacter algicola]|uniref:Cupredoxin family copper-binding protein n=1 Tax=Ramlibacter algicola TaxID=2795217 RepID=A0A934Q253_9BURK|nr:cupredoxin family copper-binding protein [Ramlibacter algicola]MBK0392909.1 cupredoxin family copper-binding protein [Ramlibacter algicola]
MLLRAACVLAVAAPLAAAAAEHTLTMEGMKIQPASLVVQRGDKVTWVNKDVVPHTATAKGVFDSGQIANGAKWTWTATKAGDFPYVCTYHPGMKAQLTVK